MGHRDFDTTVNGRADHPLVSRFLWAGGDPGIGSCIKKTSNRKRCGVYIMSSPSRTLYTVVTEDLERRVSEHKNGAIAGFTKRYKIDRLVYF